MRAAHRTTSPGVRPAFVLSGKPTDSDSARRPDHCLPTSHDLHFFPAFASMEIIAPVRRIATSITGRTTVKWRLSLKAGLLHLCRIIVFRDILIRVASTGLNGITGSETRPSCMPQSPQSA